MSLPTRIARAAALLSLLLASPALADNKKVVLSQAFQSMLYLPLYVAIDEGFFTQQGSTSPRKPRARRRWRSRR
jgi:NitT/TauT family transport system substrate-binding protein